MSGEPDSIRETVRAFILEEFLMGEDPSSLNDATPLITGGVLDSIGTVRLVTYLEETYGISLEHKDITVERFDTVRDIVSIVQTKTSKSP